MSEPTPLANAASDIAELVERYRDDALATDERDRLAQRLADDAVFAADFRAHLRMAQTLTVSLDRDPDATAARADLALAALSSTRRLSLWRAVSGELAAHDRRRLAWWRWAGAAAAALVLVAIVPWLLRSGARQSTVPDQAVAVVVTGRDPVVAPAVAQLPAAQPPTPAHEQTQTPQPTPTTPVVAQSVPADVPAKPIIVAPSPTPLAVAVAVVAIAVEQPPVSPAPQRKTPLPLVASLVASVHGPDLVGADIELSALPARGAWIIGGATVRRGARELPTRDVFTLVPGDELDIGDHAAAVQPAEGVRLLCAAHARLVVSPSTGRRQAGRYVALRSGAIAQIEVASGEMLVIATDHGEVVATGAAFTLSLHDGWLRCAVSDGNIRVGPQHRRIDSGAAAVLAGGRVLTVYAADRTGAAVLGGGWTRRGAPWFPLIAQLSTRSSASYTALVEQGFDAVTSASVGDARNAARTGLGVLLDVTPAILAQVPMLHNMPGLLGWIIPHDGSPRSLQEAVRTVTTVRRSDLAHAVISKPGPGEPGRKLAAAVDALVTGEPAQQTTHAPLARLTVSADAPALRHQAYSALVDGACGLLVVDPQSQPAVVGGLLAELVPLTPLLAAGEREVVAAPAGSSAARWSDGHDTLLIAVNASDQPLKIALAGAWVQRLRPLVSDGDDSPLVAGALSVPAHGVCVLRSGPR